MLQRLICLIANTLLPPTTPKAYLRLAYFLIICWLPVKILQYPVDNISWKQNQTFPSISLDRFQRESSNSSMRVSRSPFINKYWLSGIRSRMILLQKSSSFNYSSVKPTGPPRCSVLTTKLTHTPKRPKLQAGTDTEMKLVLWGALLMHKKQSVLWLLYSDLNEEVLLTILRLLSSWSDKQPSPPTSQNHLQKEIRVHSFWGGQISVLKVSCKT